MATIGSNLDINSIVSQLMTVEQRPLKLLASKEAGYQAKLSAYGSIKSAMSSFQTAMNGLTATDKFTSSKTTISDTAIATATGTAAAAAGKYNIEVQSLAQAQKLKSGNYSATTDTLGSGTLTIQFGRYADGAFTANGDKSAKTIEIKPANNSLGAVRDAINAANVGVTASIVNDGNSNRLVIGSKDSGLDNALRITVNDSDGDNADATGLSALAFDASTDAISNLSETVAAKNAAIVVDGIAISKNSNTITDAIDGVTLNLVKAAAEPVTLSVTRDNSGTKTAIDGFVKAYNDLYKTLSNMSSYNAETKQAAILQGDSAVRTMQSRLRGMVSGTLDGAGGGLARMSDIGVTIQTDGTLKVDSIKLQKVLDNPAKDVATLFASIAKPSDSLVSFASAGADAKNGTHALNITQLATQGKAVGSVAAATEITAGVNDKLKLKVDGVETTVTIGAGTYTAATLAAELQSKINGATGLNDADVSVAVSQSDGVLSVVSKRYGSASKVEIVGGTAATALFGTAAATDGLDVAGTVGGTSATGSGQKLTGLGISLNITGGALGERGTINFARGFAAQFADLAKTFLEDDGLLDGRTDGLDRSIKDITARRDALNVRLGVVEQRYRAQFTALDVMLSSMQSTSNYLEQQLANLPKIGE